MKKVFSSLMIMMLMVFLVSNGGLASSTVTFQGWIAMEKSGVEAWQIMTDTFEKENANINVEYIGTPWEQQLNQVTISARAGNPPDTAQLTADWVPQLAEMGVLEPLSKYFTIEELNDIPEAALDAGMYKGKLYSVPWAPGPIVLYGRVDLMKRAGFDYNKGPETWEEFENMVKKITALDKTEDGKKIYGFACRTAKVPNTGFWFLPAIWAYGGKIIDEDGKVVFNSPEVIAALDWIQNAAKNKEITEGVNTRISRNLFAQGQAAFAFDGPWFRGIIRQISGKGKAADEDYRAYLVPADINGKSRAIANNHVLVVFKDASNKEGAIKFIKHITQKPEIVEMYHQKVGLLAPYKSLLENPEFKEDKIFIEQINTANAVPIKVPENQQVFEIVATAMQKAILGYNTTDAAKEASDSIKKIVE